MRPGTQVTVVMCLDNCELQRTWCQPYSVQVEMMPPPNQPLTGHICDTTDGEKMSKISLFVLTQLTNVTDGHSDTA